MTAVLLPTETPVPTGTSPTRGATMPRASYAVALRTVRKFIRSPQLIVVGTLQSAMFLIIFRYVFGGAIATGGVNYVDFLIPGFITTGVLFAGSMAASGVAEDLAEGFFDRLRSLPIPRSSVLVGRAGRHEHARVESRRRHRDRFRGGLPVARQSGRGVGRARPLRGLRLRVLLGVHRHRVGVGESTEPAQGLSLLVFPLTFVSSAYVPVHSMPGWLQAFATHQPITPMVDAVRSVCLGQPAGSSIAAALALVGRARGRLRTDGRRPLPAANPRHGFPDPVVAYSSDAPSSPGGPCRRSNVRRN